jgi:pyruvate dehydrogenase E2 component (dihydrolipoamide acetyltransferase)
MSTIEVTVPDIGDFTDVPVISVMVKPGDSVSEEDPLIELESDKATMEVPSPANGTVKEIKVSEGDKVSEGSLILLLEAEGAAGGQAAPEGGRTQDKGNGAAAGGGSGTIEVTVPDIGEFTDVPVIAVMVKPGDRVAEEDPLIELESDKATMEVPSPAAGTVKELKVSEGDKVSQGSLILLLDAEGAGGEASAERGRTEDKGETESGGGQSEPTKTLVDSGAEQRPGQQGGAAPTAGSSYSSKKQTEAQRLGIHASPSVRAFARQMGVELSEVEGSGRKGRILREDVANYLKKKSAPAAAPAAAAQSGGMGIPPVPKVDFSKFGPVENVDMPRIKKISGPALHRSWLNVPHVTHNEEADITEIDRYRKELDTAAKAEGYRVTLLSFLIKASVSALKQHWEVNSSIHPDGDKLIRKSYYHVGFAADTPQGLVVPVIKDADKKGLVDISKELGELSAKARKGELKGPDMQGATFTISSLGGIGGISFTPIVNAPEVAILGVTRSKMAPVWNGTEFEPRNMLPLSLSYDHRAIDGALAARFCATLRHLLGDVRRLLL